MLENEFRSCGGVDEAYNTRKGYAFVTMSDQDGADNAIKELNGTKLDGQEIKVYTGCKLISLSTYDIFG